MRSRLIALVFVSLFGARLPCFGQPNLGSASSFAVLGGRVTNTGTTIVAGNVGGFTTSVLPAFVLGDIRNDLASQAQKDTATAYNELAAPACTKTLDRELGGQTLVPGVYCVPSDATLNGTLTLSGDANGLWIFKLAGSLTTASCSLVETVNGAKDSHVFWRILGNATFGAKSTFIGNVLTAGNITLQSNANVSGRLLSQSGTVTLDNAAVTICCDVLTILEHTLPNGKPGAVYSATLSAIGGTGPYTLAKVKGDLPDGLLFSGATIFGTPTKPGVYKFAMVLSDSVGLNCVRIYTITVCAEIPFPPIPPPVVCEFYDQRVASPGITTRLTAGALPPGLSLSMDGALSGTPTSPGHYTPEITATDAGCCSTSHVYDIDVGTDALKITPDVLPNGKVGDLYTNVKLEVSGATNASFEPAVQVVPGIFLHSDGTLEGTPTAAGCYEFTVKACTLEKTYKLIICDVPVTFTPDPAKPLEATVCTPYCQKFTAEGCTGPYTYEIAGVLPSDRTFDPISGELCITPKTSADYSFTITAKGALGCTATSPEYHLKVSCPEVIIDSNLPEAKACVKYEYQFPKPVCPYKYTSNTLPLTSDGFLSFTLTTPGSYTFDVNLTLDGCPPVTTMVHLNVACNVMISPPNLPVAIFGVPYSHSLTASCGIPPYTFSAPPGTLPPGFPSLLPNGTLSGTPTAVGCFPFTVHVESAVPGCAADRTYVICVIPATTDVPTVSGWGMGVMMLLFLVCGVTILVLRESL